MLTEIQALINKKEFIDALKVIETELSKIKDVRAEEQKYTKLIQLRVSVNQQLGKIDVLIRDQVRRIEYPSEINYQIAKKFNVRLINKGIFIERSDAYVNTVFRKDPFQVIPERSSIAEFIKALGREEIDRQVKDQLPKEDGKYIILNHDKLLAPISYHILFYSNEDYSIDLLDEGINNVLDDVCLKGLKKINFFALGFDLIHKLKEDKEKLALSQEIADKTAEVISTYLNDERKKNIPDITFNFVNTTFMTAYEKAFYKWADRDKKYWNVMKKIEKTQKSLVESSLTKNAIYIEKLKELGENVDEESPTLILGETGAGKSYLAKILHDNSKRSLKEFKKLNCSLIKSERIYTQLFGWKKGSFTGSTSDGVGAIGMAEGGTLFLDEIGYADLEVQQMLLKFVEDKKYSRFGEEENERTADVKLIFGTNVNIQKRIDDGVFADDLYQRINKDEIMIPPLRERREDIPLIIDHILMELNKNGTIKVEIIDSAIELLKSYNWPGNIRQLQHYIEKLVQRIRKEKDNIIRPEFIKSRPPDNELRKKNTIREIEEGLLDIIKDWDINNGNILNDFIIPVLSKVYVEDYKGVKKNSSELIGIDGTRGNDSTLNKSLEKYKVFMGKASFVK